MRAAVTGFGTAVPDQRFSQDELWSGAYVHNSGGGALHRRLWRGVGVQRRHMVVNPLVEDVSRWSTGERMRRYVTEALPLGKEAVGAALADAGLAAEDVGLFAVASCTGYATPGVDVHTAAALGMSPEVQRLVVGHMGCYAAVPALGTVGDFAAARGRPAVLLCLELTSLHRQPPSDDPGQTVGHALFSDAAAAVVLEPGTGRGRRVAGMVARTDHSTADHMTWDVTDLGFRMGLSPRVPDVLGRHVGGVVQELLDEAGLRTEDVAGWAVHPGGPRILEVVRDTLGLTEEQMAASRRVLAEHGNCSSATVLLVLEELGDVDGPIVAMAFGPGLTLYATLLLPT